MKRLLSFVVVVVVFGWLLFKAAVWWLADQRLAEAREAFEHLGVIERGTISSGIEGRLLLSGASYQDFRLAGPLDAGRVSFDAGSPVNLLMALIDPGNLPPAWTVRGEQLALILEATMFRNWVTAAGNTSEALFVPVCGPDHRQQLGSLWAAAGREPLSAAWILRAGCSTTRVLRRTCSQLPRHRHLAAQLVAVAVAVLVAAA